MIRGNRALDAWWAAWLLLICLPAVAGCSPLSIDAGITQDRLDTPSPVLTEDCNVGQTFVPEGSLLDAIELLLVSYGDDAPGSNATITLHLRQDPRTTDDMASATLSLAHKRHNDSLRFSLDTPVEAGQPHYFCLSSNNSNVALWQSSWDSYQGGHLVIEGQTAQGDLNFKTFHAYELQDALGDLRRGLRTHLASLALAGVMLFLPGNVLRRLFLGSRYDRGHLHLDQVRRDPGADLALALGLSLAFWPLLLLWTTTAGLQLSPPVIVALLLALAAVQGYLWFRAARNRLLWTGSDVLDPYQLGLLAILLITLAIRYIQVRNLALPPWVDSVHQTLITGMIADRGAIPSSYHPYVPVTSFYRHFGFHALAAIFYWLANLELPLAVLGLGQILNGLAVLPSYWLGRRITGHRLGGLLAGVITGLISIMPAYYASWGRYTQLAGMLLLPAAMILAMDLLRLGKGRMERSVGFALAVAGLFLTHYRVLIFWLLFLLAYSACRLLRRKRFPWRRLCWATVLSLLLAAPWLARIGRNLALPRAALPVDPGSGDQYNAVPWALATAGHGETLLILAGAGLTWQLAKALVRWWSSSRPERAKDRSTRPLPSRLLTHLARRPTAPWVGPWLGLLALAANLRWLGLPDIGLINNASVIIALYLPVSLLIAEPAADIVALASGFLGATYRRRLGYLLAVLLVVLGLAGAADMVTIINPVTVLATEADVAAMAWIRQHAPPDAKFLINVRPWQRGIYMGTDGGWWIPLLANRTASLPPVVYHGGPRHYVKLINALAHWTHTVDSLGDAESIARLRQEGITHVYIGAKGGHITPDLLEDTPAFEPVYTHGPVRIYRLTQAVIDKAAGSAIIARMTSRRMHPCF